MKQALLLAALIGLSSCAAINLTPSKRTSDIAFEEGKENDSIKFIFPDTLGDLYLRQLRNEYGLEQLIAAASSEEEKVLRIMDWTHAQWKHSGSNEPSADDALTILKEAKEGQNFRCVEYGIVLKSALIAVGIRARTLGLKTKDVERTAAGAGHVASEVWLSDHKKWAFVDAQFNAMPVLDGTPLNAVEFQCAIRSGADFKIVNVHGEVDEKTRKQFLRFLPPYLYYFDLRFDQRMVRFKEAMQIEGSRYLMLVPVGATQPTVFQRKYPLDYMMYTSHLEDFYPVLDDTKARR